MKKDQPPKPEQSLPANDTEAREPSGKRGRPTLEAWDRIQVWAVRLDAQNPDMQRKQLAGQLHKMALDRYDKTAVPSESTILRKLGEFLGDPRPPLGGAA